MPLRVGIDSAEVRAMCCMRRRRRSQRRLEGIRIRGAMVVEEDMVIGPEWQLCKGGLKAARLSLSSSLFLFSPSPCLLRFREHQNTKQRNQDHDRAEGDMLEGLLIPVGTCERDTDMLPPPPSQPFIPVRLCLKPFTGGGIWGKLEAAHAAPTSPRGRNGLRCKPVRREEI